MTLQAAGLCPSGWIWVWMNGNWLGTMVNVSNTTHKVYTTHLRYIIHLKWLD